MTVDDDLLRELGAQPFAPVYRPPAEIAARARLLRRRRNVLRGGVAVALAAAVTATVVALEPGAGEVRPARSTAPIDVPCPGDGPRQPLGAAPDLVLLPPGVQVTAAEVRKQLQDCRLLHWQATFADEAHTRIKGRWMAVAPQAVPVYRGTGAVPGRHESRTIAGLPVDVWRVDEPVPQYRAFWTAPDGADFAALAEDMDGDLRLLSQMVEESKIPVRMPRQNYEPDPEFAPYFKATLDVPGTGPVELVVTRFFMAPPGPSGARSLPIPGDQGSDRALWWEENGVGHLSWNPFVTDGSTRARTLSGAGLTPERAVQLAASLRRVPLDDPRLPQS